MPEHSSNSLYGGEEVGMTDVQFKAYLLEQLKHWQRVLAMAKAAGNTDI